MLSSHKGQNPKLLQAPKREKKKKDRRTYRQIISLPAIDKSQDNLYSKFAVKVSGL